MYENLVKKDRYQVFLFSSPSSLPVSFISHTWFVVVGEGIIERRDILFRDTKDKNRHGHLNLNFFPPFAGIEIFPFIKKYLWKAKLIKYIEGDENSLAKRMVDFIKDSKNNYPYCNIYSLLGPNCNTYTQNILNHFPEFEAKLPWNALGKGYEID